MTSPRLTAASLKARKAMAVARRDGVAELGRRAQAALAERIVAAPTGLPLQAEDVVDSASMQMPAGSPVRPRGSSLEIGWISTPPGAGSGGHTTMFRYIDALDAAGHRCVLYLYDRRGGDIALAEHTIRTWWPDVRCEVRDIRDGIRTADALVATSWPAAHVLARRAEAPGRRFYLVQDFEPFFYGRGAEYVLAEDTYRFGFHCLTVGPMLADLVRTNYGATADALEFGCDRDVYGLRNHDRRHDVLFYGKPDTPRRGFALGAMAMSEFHRQRPDVPIHTFGVRTPLPFPAQRHAHLPPRELDELYNRCAAGLSLSFTNVSLIPYELMACGAVPVVNEDLYSRAVLDLPEVRWARPTPAALADALVQCVDGEGPAPVAVASALGDLSWKRSTETLVRVVEDACCTDA